MAILVDWSHLVISCYFAQEREFGTVESKPFRKHVLHTLLGLQNKFRPEFNQMIICGDGIRSWRYEVYPHYKSMRKLTRAEDAIKWKEIDTYSKTIRKEIEEHRVAPVVIVPHAEADDVIAVLASSVTEPTLIVSEDKDFHQLHTLLHVKQYSHRRASVYKSNDPAYDLKEKIIRGDRNDSIPNIHSRDDVFVLRERQTVVSAKRFGIYINNFTVAEDGIPPEYKQNFERNRKLIDFQFIPQSLRLEILQKYESSQQKEMCARSTRTLYLMQSGINPQLV